MPATQTSPSLVGNVSKVLKRSEKIWLPVWQDRNAFAIMNSAKQLPVKPYYESFSVTVYDIEIFIPNGLSDGDLYRQADSLNSGTWRGVWPRYAAWISEIICRGIKTFGSGPGEEVNYIIRCIKKPDGWRFQHPDVGYVYFNGSQYKSFSDEQGRVPIGKLNGSGGMHGMASNMLINLSDVKTEVDIASEIGY